MSELETHPCFTAKCSDYARIHLPVAPKCNMQCNYCLRKYSCVNESRPGVVARVMVPEDAVEWYLQMKGKVPKPRLQSPWHTSADTGHWSTGRRKHPYQAHESCSAFC